MTTDTSKLKQLGEHSPLPVSPDAAQLERVANPHPDSDYCTRFTCPEFTSLCPVTGQPDFAHLVIDYVPGQWLVESKSLKLYLQRFRNEGIFYEDITNVILTDLIACCRPRWMSVRTEWSVRGGIRSIITAEHGKTRTTAASTE